MLKQLLKKNNTKKMVYYNFIKKDGIIREQLEFYSKYLEQENRAEQLMVDGNYIFLNGEKEKLGKIYTPPLTASFMVSKLGILQNKLILEPSAGEGVFIKKLIKRGVNPKKIVAFDIDLNFAEKYKNFGINFSISDFLLSDVSKLFLFSEVDCVITNPPYLSRHSQYIQKNKSQLIKEFEQIGIIDTYSLFIYKGLKILKEKGILCFITGDSFLTVGYHKKLREFILKNSKIKEILLPPKNLFSNQGVSVSSCIIILEKCSNEEERNENIVHYTNRLNSEKEYFLPHNSIKIKQKTFLEIPNYPLSINVNNYTVKLLNYPIKITDVLDGHIGLHTHDNDKYIAAIEGSFLEYEFMALGRKIVSQKEVRTMNWKPYLKQGGEEKYWREIGEALDWSEDSIKKYHIPKENLFGKEGIVISGISKTLSARYMPKGCFWDTNKAIGFIPKKKEVSIYYLLGILNSKLYNYLIKGIINTTNCVQIDDIRRLPFFYPDKKAKLKIEEVVSSIISNLKKNPDSDYTEEQQQIDEIIFELYETPENLKEYIAKNF